MLQIPNFQALATSGSLLMLVIFGLNLRKKLKNTLVGLTRLQTDGTNIRYGQVYSKGVQKKAGVLGNSSEVHFLKQLQLGPFQDLQVCLGEIDGLSHRLRSQCAIKPEFLIGRGNQRSILQLFAPKLQVLKVGVGTLCLPLEEEWTLRLDLECF